MTIRFLSSLLATAFLCACLTGCGESKTEPAPTEDSTTSGSENGDETAAMDPAQRQQMQNVLVGVWLGMPQLNQERLEQKLATLDADAKARLLTFVQNFKTTVMAIEYRADGKVYSEIQVTVDNQPVFEASEGNWKVARASENRVSISTVENLADGKISQSTSDYTLYEKNNVMVTTVPTHAELADLNPQMVFTRENLDSVTAEAQNISGQPAPAIR